MNNSNVPMKKLENFPCGVGQYHEDLNKIAENEKTFISTTTTTKPSFKDPYRI